MVANVIFQAVGLAVLAGIVAVAILLWRWAMRHPLFLPAQRRKGAPGLLRKACGALGVLLVAATAGVTWQTLRAGYTPSPAPAGLTMKVPTRTFDIGALPEGKITGPLRLLADVLIMDTRQTEMAPLRVEQFDLHWPQDRQREIEVGLGDHPWRYSFEIHRIQIERKDDKPVLVIDGGRQIRQRRWLDDDLEMNESSEMRGDSPRSILGPHLPGADLSNVLSVVMPSGARYFCQLRVRPIADDDPLVTVPMEQYVQDFQASTKYAGVFGASFPEVFNFLWQAPPGGVRLLVYRTMPVMVLLVAAMLLAQVFRRRDLAFAGLVLGAVLYMVACDRVAVSIHISHMNDARQPLQARVFGAAQLVGTFFYADTAGVALASVGGMPEVPERLKEMAGYGPSVIEDLWNRHH
jgi:hypothetical protein